MWEVQEQEHWQEQALLLHLRHLNYLPHPHYCQHPHHLKLWLQRLLLHLLALQLPHHQHHLQKMLQHYYHRLPEQQAQRLWQQQEKGEVASEGKRMALCVGAPGREAVLSARGTRTPYSPPLSTAVEYRPQLYST
jgi:hypothetical protein